MPSPLLLVYDAECAPTRAWVDKVLARDSQGLLVAFPFQNPELARMVPELAGNPMRESLYGVDPTTHRVLEAPELYPEVLRRLPSCAFLALLFRIPGLGRALSSWRVQRLRRPSTARSMAVKRG